MASVMPELTSIPNLLAGAMDPVSDDQGCLSDLEESEEGGETEPDTDEDDDESEQEGHEEEA